MPQASRRNQACQQSGGIVQGQSTHEDRSVRRVKMTGRRSGRQRRLRGSDLWLAKQVRKEDYEER